jgi:hypothetical protein
MNGGIEVNTNLKSSNEFNFGYGDFTIDYWVSNKERKIEMTEHPFIKKVKCKHCNGTGDVKNGKMCVRCRGTGFWLKSLDEKVVGVFKSCRGTGFKNDQHCYDRIVCNDCRGFGYMDWLDKIFPKQKEEIWNIKHNRKLKTTYTIQSDKMTTLFNDSMQDEIVRDLVKQLSEEIDGSILNKLLKKFAY